ncbi:MAG: thymidylate synthase [Candidatus Pacearchaeota archaeon]
MEIIEDSALKAWKKALRIILEKGTTFKDRRERICKEILNLRITIKDSSTVNLPLNILNGFNKWVYPSLEELKNAILEKEENHAYYYHYAERAFHFNGKNQIDNYVIPLLKKDPTSKRAIVVFYFPEEDSSLSKKETPGMVLMNFNIREDKLHSTTVIRSNDLFFGWPANIVQTYFLVEYISKELNYPIGDMTTLSISAHIFEDQFEYINEVLNK